MATNAFGDVIDEVSTSPSNVNAFGDVIDVSTQETILPRGTSPREQFEQQFIASQTAPITQQLATLAGQGVDVLGNLATTASGGATGLGEVLAQDLSQLGTPPKSLEEGIKRALMLSFPPAAVAPNLTQSALEGTQRAFDLGPIIRQSLDRALADPTATGKTLLTALATSPLMAAVLPSTPSPEQISQRFVESQLAPELALQRQQPVLPEIIGQTNIPLAEGIALAEQALPILPGALRGTAGALETVASPVTKGVQRGFRVPTIEKATGLVGVGESEGLVDILQSSTPRILESTPIKSIKNSKDLVKASETAQTAALSEAKQYLGEAGESGLSMQGSSLMTSGRDAILRDFPSLAETPQAIDNALKEFSYLSGNITPTKGQQFLSELNRRYDSLLDKNSPVGSAYRSIRGDLSTQLDEIVKATSGKDISPYRDWGKIEQFKTGVKDRIAQAEASAGREAVPVSPDAPSGLPLGFGKGAVAGAIARRVTRGARPLIKQPIEFVDEASQAVIKDSPKAVRRLDLPEETILTLRSKYSQITPTPKPDALNEALLRNIERARLNNPDMSLEDIMKVFNVN